MKSLMIECASMWRLWEEKFMQSFDRKSERKTPLQRQRRLWRNNINMYLKEIDWEGINRISKAENRDKYWAVLNVEMSVSVTQIRGVYWIAETESAACSCLADLYGRLFLCTALNAHHNQHGCLQILRHCTFHWNWTFLTDVYYILVQN